MEKIVGDKCPDCGTPYIMGPKGAYCKPCYVKWANTNKPQNAPVAPNYTQTPQGNYQVQNTPPQPSQPQIQPTDWDKVNADKEKSMEWLNAKNVVRDWVSNGIVPKENFEAEVKAIYAVMRPDRILTDQEIANSVV